MLKKAQKHWATHFWPCILLLINGYILDEAQISLNPPDRYSQETAFYNVTCICSWFLELRSPGLAFNSKTMVQSDGIQTCFARLLHRYLERYRSMRVRPGVFRRLTLGVSSSRAIEHLPSTIPLFASLIFDMKFKPPSTETCSEMQSFFPCIASIVHDSESLTRQLIDDYPDAIDWTLQC